MTPLKRISFAAAILSLCIAAAAETERGKSQWIYPGPGGKLEYKKTPADNRILDFSYAGYMGGGVALPSVPVVRTVHPVGSGKDDSAAIQAAIDQVAAMPLKQGFRGAVLLSPGVFECSQPIRISTAGVTLRGSGATTTIKLTGSPHCAFEVRPPGAGRNRRNADDESELPADSPATSSSSHKHVETTLGDGYVPSGAMSFTVADATGFAAGDTIVIKRPVTKAWVHFMQMDDLVRDGKPQTWIKVGDATDTWRTIAAISGKTITLDAPLSDSFDAKFLNPPGTRVIKAAPPPLTQVGIERLHIESPPQAISHTQPHFQALRMNGQDCWVRDVTIDETMNSVGVNGRRITLEKVSVTRKARHQGASLPAEFAPNASQCLLDRCSVTADNVWYVATGSGVAGPVAILNCTFKGDGTAEAHARWSTGILFDNCRVPGGGIDLRNRGSMGSGHGWSMGWGVLWNCEAKSYVVQNTPGAPNWMIGCIGEARRAPRPFSNAPDLPEGTIDSPGAPVTPTSLYLAQLAERLGPQALKNIGYSSVADAAKE